jgi:hypothetical protein
MYTNKRESHLVGHHSPGQVGNRLQLVVDEQLTIVVASHLSQCFQKIFKSQQFDCVRSELYTLYIMHSFYCILLFNLIYCDKWVASSGHTILKMNSLGSLLIFLLKIKKCECHLPEVSSWWSRKWAETRSRSQGQNCTSPAKFTISFSQHTNLYQNRQFPSLEDTYL